MTTNKIWTARLADDMSRLGAVLRLRKHGDQCAFDVTGLTMEKIEIGMMSSGCVLADEDAVSFCQAVMDAAWEYGLRPSGAKDERYLQEHLKDMREITKHLLKMDKTSK